jgi:hypothetical protein
VFFGVVGGREVVCFCTLAWVDFSTYQRTKQGPKEVLPKDPPNHPPKKRVQLSAKSIFQCSLLRGVCNQNTEFKAS